MKWIFLVIRSERKWKGHFNLKISKVWKTKNWSWLEKSIMRKQTIFKVVIFIDFECLVLSPGTYVSHFILKKDVDNFLTVFLLSVNIRYRACVLHFYWPNIFIIRYVSTEIILRMWVYQIFYASIGEMLLNRSWN